MAGGWLEFGSSPETAAVRGRCVKAHCHNVGHNCFSILPPFSAK